MVSPYRTAPHHGLDVRRNPVNLIRMFKIANDYKLLIDPNTLREVTRSRHLIDKNLRENPEANKLFLEILTSRNHPERILRRMNEAGVLGAGCRFGRIVAMMQLNMYHHYTADEHLLRAIGILSELERGELEDDSPLAHRLMSKYQPQGDLPGCPAPRYCWVWLPGSPLLAHVLLGVLGHGLA